jgi:putative transposase
MRRWTAMGLFDALPRGVAVLRRRAARRRWRGPRLAIVDTQAAPCIAVRGPRGFDAGKKVEGRERVLMADAGGFPLALPVVPASVQDRDRLPALDGAKERWPTLREALFDGAFGAERCVEWCSLHGLRHRIASRREGAKGFVVVPRRWVVERTFGWLHHWNGLARDRAGRLDVSAARVELAFVLAGVDALLNPAPITAPD